MTFFFSEATLGGAYWKASFEVHREGSALI